MRLWFSHTARLDTATNTFTNATYIVTLATKTSLAVAKLWLDFTGNATEFFSQLQGPYSSSKVQATQPGSWQAFANLVWVNGQSCQSAGGLGWGSTGGAWPPALSSAPLCSARHKHTVFEVTKGQARTYYYMSSTRRRGNMNLASLPLVSVRRHGHENSVKVETKFRLQAPFFVCTIYVATNASN